jgi:competence protein ComEC
MILIETVENEKIMIDTGPPEFSQGHFSQSAQSYFQKKGISTLDWLIVTHAHNDHYGGLEHLLKEIKIKNLAVTDEFQGRSIWHYFKPLLPKQTSVFTVRDTLTLPLESVTLKILHPDSTFYHTNINNMSITAKLTYKHLNILFPGDLEEEGEHFIAAVYHDFLPSKVLKAGHHGSKTASSDEFIAVVKPEFVFIPTSLKNRFHFPHEITLQRFAHLQDKMLIAGKDGALQIETDGETATFHTFKSKKTFFEKWLGD